MGETSVFLCKGNSTPVWLFNDKPIHHSNIITGVGGEFYWLKIMNAQKDNSGEYKCMIEVDLLIDEDAGYLKVMGMYETRMNNGIFRDN